MHRSTEETNRGLDGSGRPPPVGPDPRSPSWRAPRDAGHGSSARPRAGAIPTPGREQLPFPSMTGSNTRIDPFLSCKAGDDVLWFTAKDRPPAEWAATPGCGTVVPQGVFVQA